MAPLMLQLATHQDMSCAVSIEFVVAEFCTSCVCVDVVGGKFENLPDSKVKVLSEKNRIERTKSSETVPHC